MPLQMPPEPTSYGLVAEDSEFEKKELSELRLIANEEETRAEARASFDAAQGLLSQLITMSSLLLGFIVTGSMLSVAMTGDQNYSIGELIGFMRWSGISALCAAVALTLGFLTSVRATYVMETRGIVKAERQITTGGRCKTSLAEMLIYVALMFFLLSMRQFLGMVYTGPNFCPSYEGSASRCALLGKSFYEAAKVECASKFGTYPCSKPAPACSADSTGDDCLCNAWCSKNWAERSEKVSPEFDVFQYHWFAYYHVPTTSRQARWEIVNRAADVSCQVSLSQETYEQCISHTAANKQYVCAPSFSAWQKAQECQAGKQLHADECGKVCSWHGGIPPHEAVHRVQDMGIVPVCIVLVLVIGCRFIVLFFRLAKSCRTTEDFKENAGIMDIETQIAESCDCCFRKKSQGDDSDEES